MAQLLVNLAKLTTYHWIVAGDCYESPVPPQYVAISQAKGGVATPCAAAGWTNAAGTVAKNGV